MGAAFVSGSFLGFENDWKEKISRIQDNAEEEYGTDLYNGHENNVDFGFGGDKSKLSKSELKKFELDLLQKLGKREGTVIRLAVEKYQIAKTAFVEMNEASAKTTAKMVKQDVKFTKAAVLVVETDFLEYKKIAEGTLAEMKKKAHEYMRETRYQEGPLTIVGKTKSYRVKPDIKYLKKTAKTTSATTQVLPIYLYRYYGWAPE